MRKLSQALADKQAEGRRTKGEGQIEVNEADIYFVNSRKENNNEITRRKIHGIGKLQWTYKFQPKNILNRVCIWYCCEIGKILKDVSC